MQKRVLIFAAALEIGASLVFIADPALVARLLTGGSQMVGLSTLGRLAGFGLLALGVACWPVHPNAKRSYSPALRGLLTYNALVMFYLTYLGAVERVAGPLLWPAAALHAVTTCLLVAAGGKSAAHPTGEAMPERPTPDRI